MLGSKGREAPNSAEIHQGPSGDWKGKETEGRIPPPGPSDHCQRGKDRQKRERERSGWVLSY